MAFPYSKNDINLPDVCYNPIILIKTNSNTILLWNMPVTQTKAALRNTILINSYIIKLLYWAKQ